MIRLEEILPELEMAVKERRESSKLATMDPGDLRDLIYALVQERLHSTLLDASDHFDEMVKQAEERHADIKTANEYALAVRRDVLAEILRVVDPVIGAIATPIEDLGEIEGYVSLIVTSKLQLWLVAVRDQCFPCTSARYAYGSQDTLEVIDCDAAASVITNKKISKILDIVYRRVAALARVRRGTDTLWKAAEDLAAALEAMRKR